MSLRTAAQQANELTAALRRAQAASQIVVGVSPGGAGAGGSRQILIELQGIRSDLEVLGRLEPAPFDGLTMLRGEGLL